MSHSAIVKIAPVFDPGRDLDPDLVGRGRTLYSSGSLTLVGNAPPVLIDHDRGRPIGVVRELFEHEDTDRRWICAHCSIDTHKAPDWLRGGRTGTRASFAIATIDRTTFRGVERVVRGLVSEVSVLPPGVKPAEPLASVAWFGPAPVQRQPSTPAAKATRKITHTPAAALVRRPAPRHRADEEIDELQRRRDWLGPSVPMEVILENLRRELAWLRSEA